MKKLLVLLLALVLTGCGAAAPSEEMIRPDQLPPLDIVPEEPVQEPLAFVVELETVEGKVDTMDGERLVEHCFRLPQMSVQLESGGILTEGRNPEENVAVAMADAFNARFAEWRAPDTLMELVQAAQDDLDSGKELGIEWTQGHVYDLDCTVYQTARLVSVSGVYCAYTGGAHPNTYLMGWNFDLKTGSFLGAEELVGREDLREAVTQELLRQAKERAEQEGVAPEEFFWPEYETILADWPSYAVTFGADGMTVAFSPYELAAYAAGVQAFPVDYELMRPYLDADGLELMGLE